MTMFFVAIWLGGVDAMPSRKIGFWRRVFWPCDLGVHLFETVFDKR